MKQLNFTDFNQNGSKALLLSFNFNASDGLTITEKELTVSVSPNISPADDCDFIANSTSYCSEDFFELNGLPQLNHLFFSHEYNHSVKTFVLALPENKELVIEEVTNHMNAWIKERLQAQISKAQDALKLVA